MPTDTAPLALVTGGNRGLGLETCRQLAARGWRVLLTARDAEKARAAAASLEGAGGEVVPEVLDVTDDASVEALVARLDGPLDALVNNAGISMHGFDAEVVRGTLAVNLFGAVRVTDALLPRMRAGGRVVMVSSGLGSLSGLDGEALGILGAEAPDRAAVLDLCRRFPELVAKGRYRDAGLPSSAYGTSKAALGAMTRVYARAWPTLKVNAVGPGWVRTDMGGAAAPRSVEDGAAGITWAATLPADGPTGGMFRDGAPVPW